MASIRDDFLIEGNFEMFCAASYKTTTARLIEEAKQLGFAVGEEYGIGRHATSVFSLHFECTQPSGWQASLSAKPRSGMGPHYSEVFPTVREALCWVIVELSKITSRHDNEHKE